MIYLWAFVFLFVYIFMLYRDPRRKIDQMFPGPFRLPFVGNALSFITSPKDIYKMYLNLPKIYNYKTLRIWFLHTPYIGVTDYRVAKLILSNPSLIDKADEYKYFEPWLGEKFLFTGPEKIWKKARKLITPAFHFKILNQYFGVFCENADILCRKLEKHDGKKAFDISDYLALYALDNICDAAMGVNLQAQNDPGSSYVKAVKSIAKVIYHRILMLWLRSDIIFKMSSLSRLQEKSLKILHGYSHDVIQKRKNQLKQNVRQQNEGSDSEQKAFLDTLLENGQALGFTDVEIRQTVDAIMFAGHDTVSATMGFLLYSLAEHQEVQDKIYQEMEGIFQKSDRCPTFDDIQEMKYTEQAIKETLRLFTVVPLVARKLKDDLYINKKQYIPKDMTVAIVMGAIHRDPEIWPDPDKFDPERFSPEASKNRDPYTFLPFSAGPRNCIGQKLAMYEMKITLSRILKKFKFFSSDDPQDEMKVRPNFVLTSANGIRIKVESRNSQLSRPF